MENNYTTYSDKDIITKMLKKKEEGITALYNQYNEYLLSVIMQRVKHKYFAELALQNTLLKAWTYINSFNIQKGKFVFWLLRIAINASIDIIRSKQYKDSLKLTNLESLPIKKEFKTNTSRLDNFDIREIIEKKLDAKYSKIIDLIHFEGYTCKEVSQELNIPLGTVKSRTRKAYKELRQEI